MNNEEITTRLQMLEAANLVNQIALEQLLKHATHEQRKSIRAGIDQAMTRLEDVPAQMNSPIVDALLSKHVAWIRGALEHGNSA